MKVDKITLGYDGKVIAQDISFAINGGDYLCIVGDNGTGKSTLIKALLKLHKPISGQIELGDVARNEIGYLPQQDDIQKDFPASVNEIVLSGCLNQIEWWRPFYMKKERELVKRALETTNVADLAKRCYRELSGGQQQRVLLARALVSARKLIVLDEPVAGLDPDATKEMYKAIKQINKDGITVIMVSHDVETALKSASHILHIGKEACFFGSVDEYKKVKKNVY